jgi:WD40 repeat protein
VWEPFQGGIAADQITFSPGGQSIAYVSCPDRKLWKCNKDWSGKLLLEDELRVFRPLEPVPGSGRACALSWSPDGKWLAGVTLETSSPYLYNFAIGKWAEVGHDGGC